MNDQVHRDQLNASTGVRYWVKVNSIDGLWDADLRYEAEDLPGAHGERSGESFLSGKDITLAGEIRARDLGGLRAGQRDLQTAFGDLQRHPLEFKLWDEEELIIVARKNQRLSMAEEQQDERFAREFVVSVRADDPRAVSKRVELFDMTGIGIFTPAQRTYDVAGAPTRRDYDAPTPETRVYSGGGGIPLQGVVNEGNADADMLVHLFGDITNPTLWNRTTGEALVWSDYQVPGGQFLEVDTNAGTVKLDGTTELYIGFDFINSTFIKLRPGFNELAIDADAHVPGAHAEVSWRHTYR
jgi:Phage tail protein